MNHDKIRQDTTKCGGCATPPSSALALFLDSSSLATNLTYDQAKTHMITPGGVKMTITMTIHDASVPGGVNISFLDLDTFDRRYTSETGFENGDCSERVEIASDSMLSKAYLTKTGNLLRVSQGSSGVLFRGTQLDDSTNYSGFAVQVSPVNTIKWAGGSCGTGLYRGSGTIGIRPLTKLYDNENSKVSDTWTVSDAGGIISMTETYDNSTINYSTEDIKYGAQKYVVRFYTHQKPTTFTTGAKEGYKLEGMNYSTSYGSTNPADGAVTLDANKQWTHTLESGNVNHYAGAFYVPMTSSVKVHKVDQDGNPIKGVTFTASGTSSVHGDFSISAQTDANGDAVISGIPYGKATDAYKLTETVPDGYKAVGDNPQTFYYKDTQQTFNVTNEKFYKVTYVVNEDNVFGAPADSVTPTDNTEYKKNDPVTVADDLSSAQNYGINTKTGDRVPGSWVFTPWDKDDFNITEDTTITGAWTFVPDTYKVNYEWTGDVPETVTLPTDDTDYDWHATPSPDGTYTDATSIGGTRNGVPGTYTFSGWDASDDPDLTDKGMEGNVTFKGEWTFTPDTYTLTYNIGGDDDYGIPDDCVTPDPVTGIEWDGTVDSLAPAPTTTWTTGDGTDSGVPGVWEFAPVRASDDTYADEITSLTGIKEDKNVYGKWTFLPSAIEVTKESDLPAGEEAKLGQVLHYTVTVTNSGKTTLSNIVVDDELAGATLADGESNTIASLAPGAYAVVHYAYEVTEADIISGSVINNVTATGQDPNGNEVNDDAEVEDPTEWNPAIEVTKKSDLADGEKAHLGQTITYTVTVTNTGNVTISDIAVTDDLPGATLAAGQSDTIASLAPAEPLTVTYNVAGDEDYGIPSDSVTPAPVTGIEWEGSVDPLADVPTTSWKTSDGTTDGIPGEWKFSPAWASDDTCSDELTKLENITESKEVYGMWTFTPDTYEVSYVVEEDEEWGKPADSVPPVDSKVYDYKETVNVADNLTTTQDYAADPNTGKKVPGTWTFVPWDKDDFRITEDPVITGSWQFTPDKTPAAAADTGDDSGMGLGVALLALSGAVLAGVRGRRRFSKHAE